MSKYRNYVSRLVRGLIPFFLIGLFLFPLNIPSTGGAIDAAFSSDLSALEQPTNPPISSPSVDDVVEWGAESVHQFMPEMALSFLNSQGFNFPSQFGSSGDVEFHLRQGAIDEDYRIDSSGMGDDNAFSLNHGFDPDQGPYSDSWVNPSGFDNAFVHANWWFQNALKFYQDNRFSDSLYALGRCSHLVEDASTPAHAHRHEHAFGLPYVVTKDALEVWADVGWGTRGMNKNPNWLDSQYMNHVQGLSNIPTSSIISDAYRNLYASELYEIENSGLVTARLFYLFYEVANRAQAFHSEHLANYFENAPANRLYGEKINWAGWNDDPSGGLSEIISGHFHEEQYARCLQQAQCVFPLAIKATAMIYRLFLNKINTPPSIRQIAPNGGEIWPIGSAKSIVWEEGATDSFNEVQIFISRSPNQWEHLVTLQPAPDQSSTYLWTVTGPSSNTCRIRIVYWNATAGNYLAADESDNYFSIGTSGNAPPSVPGNPTPSSGSVNRPVSQVLQWNPCSDPEGDPITYDVYFGTSSSPPLVSQGQTGTSYDPPGNLSYSTTYYWKVAAKDSHGAATSGPLWSFTTAPQTSDPLPIIEASIPASGTVNQPVTLSFTLGNAGGAAEHGGISISFPELNVVSAGSMPPYSSTKGDVAASSPDGLSLGFYDVGDQIAKYPPSSGNVAAQHLLVEGIYGSWGANVGKSLNLSFTPKTTGTYHIRFRGWLTKNGFQTYFGHPSSGSTDQQGFYTFEQTIQVSSQPPQTGTINVQSSPSGASFSIAGPGYSNNGSSPWTQTGLAPGDYTVTWGDLSNYTKPNPNTQTLPAGGAITFNGNYTPADPGYGQLLGFVRDPQGNPIEGARVTLSNSQYADTDGSGYYLIWYVPPGSYSAQAKKNSYADSNPVGVIVQPYNATVHDFTLTKLQQFSLTLNVNPAGSGYISADPVPDPTTGKYAIGTFVTLTPHPAPGYTFSTWSGDAFGSSYPTQVHMNGNKSVTAVFNPPGEAWKETSNGLYGAQVDSIAIDPQNSSIVYAGTGNGVYKTVNGGGTWTRTSTGLTSLFVGVLAVSQSSPSTIYAGTLGGGVFKSIDSGANWSTINSGLSGLPVSAIAIDPQNANTVYVGTYGGAFKTINGSSWSAINNGLGNMNVHCLLLHPQNANILFAATGGGCYKSTNGGLNWSWLSDDLGGPTHTLAIDPTNNNLMFAATFSGIVLYKSTNGGVNWSPASTGLPASPEVLGVHPSDSNTVYAATGKGIFKTMDGATSWTSVNVGLTNLSVRSLALDRQNPSNLYAGTVYSGVFKTTDAASSWQSANVGLNSASIKVIVADPKQGGTIYAGLVNNGIFKTIDGATSWMQINNGLSGLETMPRLIIHPSVLGLLYAGMGDGIYQTTDGGATWTRTSTLSATCMILHPANPAIIYAGGNGVFTSLDGGYTWTRTSTGLANRTVKAVVINPLTPSTLYVGTDSGVYKTTDGALNWTKTSTGITPVGGEIPGISCMVINPQNPEIVYAGTWSGSDGGIYKTSNGGANWSLVNNGLTNLSVASLIVDPLAPDTVYAGLDAAGVCKTTNAGGNWVPMNSSLTDNSIMGLTIDPLTASIYAGTAGAGVFKYPYAGQLPKITLTAYVEPSGSGTVAVNPLPGADGMYVSGTKVTLTASANAGYKFDHWSGPASGTETPTQICLSANSEAIAHFSPLPAPVIFGRVVRAATGQGLAGINLSLTNGGGSTVTATDGYYLKQVPYGWSGTVTPSSPMSGSFTPATRTYPALTEGLINQDYVWTPPSFILNVQLGSGGGGMVISNPAQPTGGYLAGTEVRLTAYPSSGYSFSGWSGDASGTNNPIQTVVDRNKSVMASFVLSQSQSQTNLSLLPGWNLISLPFQPESPSPASVFSGLPSGWVLFAWDGANNRYQGGGQISLTTGVGYWLKLPGGNPLFCSISGQLVTSDPFLVPLSEGWNIIGIPYLNNVSWANARLRYLGNDYTLANAVAQNYIAGAVYFWTGTGYGNVAGGNFEPGKGYWLRVKISGCSLVFPKP